MRPLDRVQETSKILLIWGGHAMFIRSPKLWKHTAKYGRCCVLGRLPLNMVTISIMLQTYPFGREIDINLWIVAPKQLYSMISYLMLLNYLIEI